MGNSTSSLWSGPGLNGPTNGPTNGPDAKAMLRKGLGGHGHGHGPHSTSAKASSLPPVQTMGGGAGAGGGGGGGGNFSSHAALPLRATPAARLERRRALTHAFLGTLTPSGSFGRPATTAMGLAPSNTMSRSSSVWENKWK